MLDTITNLSLDDWSKLSSIWSFCAAVIWLFLIRPVYKHFKSWFNKSFSIAGTQFTWLLDEWIVWKKTTLVDVHLNLLVAPTGSDFIIWISKSVDFWETYISTEKVILKKWTKYIKSNLNLQFNPSDYMRIEILQTWSQVAWQSLNLIINWK